MHLIPYISPQQYEIGPNDDLLSAKRLWSVGKVLNGYSATTIPDECARNGDEISNPTEVMSFSRNLA